MLHKNGQAATVKLSVCIIVKNEAALLKRCIESVMEVADEIVVVDTGSTDETIAVARALGANVVESPWCDDFAFSRNVSIEHATGAWILWLDADDVVPRASLQPLQTLKMNPPQVVYSFTVRNERPGNTGSEFTQARMFPNHAALRFERSIHEQIMPSALRIGMKLEQQSSVVIEHHGYADPQTLRKKAARNTAMLLKEYPKVAPDPVMAAEIADSYWLVDDLDEALTWYREVTRLLCDSTIMPALLSQAYYGMGNVYNKQERFDDAIAQFKKASALAPWRPDVLYSLAVALELSGRRDEAVSVLLGIGSMEASAGQVGVDFRAAKIKAYLRVIRLLVEMQRLDEAENVVKEALQRVGSRPEIQTIAGKLYLKRGHLMEALHAFEASLKLHHAGNLDAFIGLCCIYTHAGRSEVVKDTFNALTPEYKENRRFQLARALFFNSFEQLEGEHGTVADQVNELQREFFGALPKLP